MIGRIHGTLIQKTPPQILVDCGGVGYEIDVPMSTFYDLPAEGGTVTLFTHLAVREDSHMLYGFKSPDERAVFRLLIRISGIGARTALALLSGLSAADLAHSVTLQDTSRLVKIPGIGKKTAERIIMELEGKLTSGAAPAVTSVVENNAMADIRNALLALGYSDKETLAALKQIPENCAVSDGIKAALKFLSKG